VTLVSVFSRRQVAVAEDRPVVSLPSTQPTLRHSPRTVCVHTRTYCFLNTY